ncbi:metallothionein [Thalassoporum mexicanum]|uniref:metallothionein n=1 Tax=Thalassoporum mexicanum TaxID=3457544 RepID=UPI0002EFD5EA|nr:metallothionein [Pseudanabaena sp. PCC 7367]
MASATLVKCACSKCLCVIDPSDAIEANGKYYCCKACASGHVDGTNDSHCSDVGCECTS